MQLWENGITIYMKRKYFPTTDSCKVSDVKQQKKLAPWKLIDLSPAFFILGAGLSLATIVFIFELICGSRRGTRRQM